MQIPRATYAPQTIHQRTATHYIAPETQVMISAATIHHNPDVWGPDAFAFRPTRFLEPEYTNTQRQHFLPWSKGPRQCPGMKIAQIMFAALMVTVFSKARVDCARRLGDKTVEEARRRTLGVVENSAPVVALQIANPREVVLAWRKRG
jgi:cytochrome P450